MRSNFRRCIDLGRSEAAATTVEYGILAALVSLGMFVSTAMLGHDLRAPFERLDRAVDKKEPAGPEAYVRKLP